MYNPPNTHYCHADFNDWYLSIEEIQAIMGQNGEHLKRLTKECNVKYVWWNDQKKIIEIWGPHSVLWNAREKIIDHVRTSISQDCFMWKFCEMENMWFVA